MALSNISVDKGNVALPNEIICLILEYLPTEQLFQLQIVNKQWKGCARKVIRGRMSVLFGVKSDKISVTNSTLHVPYYLNENNLAIIKKIISKCSNVKTFSLNYYMTCTNNLMSITDLLPELEEVSFKTKNKQKDKQLFTKLNKCKNLKKLKWEGHYGTKMDNQNVINVLRRVNHLQIKLYHFVQLKMGNLMDNLIELRIDNFGNHCERILVDENCQEMDSITFPNLKKLWLEIQQSCLNLIAKLEFPQLEFVDFFFYDNQPNQRFVEQIKNVKILNCKRVKFDNIDLLSFNNLTEISLKSDLKSRLINDMIIHNSLQKISLNGNYSPDNIIEILNKLIILGHKKSTAQINIRLNFIRFNQEEQQTLDEYKAKFEINNWKVNINNNNNNFLELTKNL